MGLSVHDFCRMCFDTNSLVVVLFDIESNEEVYEGVLDDMPMEYKDALVDTFDPPSYKNMIELNVFL